MNKTSTKEMLSSIEAGASLKTEPQVASIRNLAVMTSSAPLAEPAIESRRFQNKPTAWMRPPMRNWGINE